MDDVVNLLATVIRRNVKWNGDQNTMITELINQGCDRVIRRVETMELRAAENGVVGMVETVPCTLCSDRRK